MTLTDLAHHLDTAARILAVAARAITDLEKEIER